VYVCAYACDIVLGLLSFLLWTAAAALGEKVQVEREGEKERERDRRSPLFCRSPP